VKKVGGISRGASNRLDGKENGAAPLFSHWMEYCVGLAADLVDLGFSDYRPLEYLTPGLHLLMRCVGKTVGSWMQTR